MSTASRNMQAALDLRERELAAERHNAYGWIKPDATACHLCGKKEYATPVDGFQVQECDRCGRPVCENDAESDYDMVGDPLRFVNTQWVCAGEARTECERIAERVTLEARWKAIDAEIERLYAERKTVTDAIADIELREQAA